MSLFAYLKHNLSPFLVRFPEAWGLPIEGIRFYGLAYLAGYLIGWALLILYSRRGLSPLDTDQRYNLIFALILGVALGGRLGFLLLYDSSGFFQNPLVFFQVWKGGMASHGGILGVALAAWVFCRREKIPFLQIADLVCSLAPPGLFLGRLANFINGELYGKPTTVPWAVYFREPDPISGLWLYLQPRHPSQLYEAALEGLLLGLWLQWRLWSASRLPFGRISAEFMIGYALLRILGEQFREPDAPLLLGLSRGAFYSLFMLLAGAALLLLSRRQPLHPRPLAST